METFIKSYYIEPGQIVVSTNDKNYNEEIDLDVEFVPDSSQKLKKVNLLLRTMSMTIMIRWRWYLKHKLKFQTQGIGNTRPSERK